MHSPHSPAASKTAAECQHRHHPSRPPERRPPQPGASPPLRGRSLRLCPPATATSSRRGFLIGRPRWLGAAAPGGLLTQSERLRGAARRPRAPRMPTSRALLLGALALAALGRCGGEDDIKGECGGSGLRLGRRRWAANHGAPTPSPGGERSSQHPARF